MAAIGQKRERFVDLIFERRHVRSSIGAFPHAEAVSNVFEAHLPLFDRHRLVVQNVVDLVLGHRLGDAWTVGVTTDRLIDGEDIGLMRGRAIGHDGLLVFVKNTTAGVEKSCLLAREERGRSSAAIEPKASH